MKLWIGAETQVDVVDAFRVVRKEVELNINAGIADKQYDVEIDGWKVIVILRDDSEFGEVVRYSKARKSMDFRLRLAYDQFVNTDDKDRKRMLFGVLIRSLELLTTKGVNPIGVTQLMEDVKQVGASKDWV